MNKEMSMRERFQRVMHYQPVDYVPMMIPGILEDTRQRWLREGLPENANINAMFGIPKCVFRNISGNVHIHPQFPSPTIEETDEFILKQNAYGNIVKNFKHHNTAPEIVEYRVKTPEDFRRLLDERMPLDNLDSRYPDKWEEQVRAAAASDDLVMVNAGWYYYTLTQILGTENASLFLYDAYKLVDEYFERINAVALDGIKRAAKLTKIDVICFGEDIAYKNGPFISPDMNRALLVPRYKKIMDLANSVGFDIAFFGSDGDFRLLLNDYLSVGVNTIEPCEVAANMVPVELRRQFGCELRMIGGIDKREIAKGPKHIDAEIERNRSVIEEGGYLPYVDHTFSADISYANFCYYMEALKKALGIP